MEVALAGERQICFSPLMRAVETPGFIDIDGLESQPENSTKDEVSQACSGVFDELSMGGTDRRGWIVAPTCDPVPLSGGVAVKEADLRDRPRGAGFFESRKKACFAILA